MSARPPHIQVMSRPAATYNWGLSGCCLPSHFSQPFRRRPLFYGAMKQPGLSVTPVPGRIISAARVKRDDKASDALYFKFHVDPISDLASEHYFAGFQLFEGNEERC